MKTAIKERKKEEQFPCTYLLTSEVKGNEET